MASPIKWRLDRGLEHKLSATKRLFTSPKTNPIIDVPELMPGQFHLREENHRIHLRSETS
jgi:hypothetical protein